MASETAAIVIAQAETGHAEPAATDAGHGSTETTGAENLAHAEVGMPQLDFSIYPNLIFWLLVAIVALYFILSRVALPRIGTVLAERNDAIANDIEMAALLKRRADEAEAAYNAALAQARDEAHKIAAETKAGIDKELASLLAKADAEIGVKTGGVGEAHRRDPRQRGARASRRSPARPWRRWSRRCCPGRPTRRAIDAALANRLKG